MANTKDNKQRESDPWKALTFVWLTVCETELCYPWHPIKHNWDDCMPNTIKGLIIQLFKRWLAFQHFVSNRIQIMSNLKSNAKTYYRLFFSTCSTKSMIGLFFVESVLSLKCCPFYPFTRTLFSEASAQNPLSGTVHLLTPLSPQIVWWLVFVQNLFDKSNQKQWKEDTIDQRSKRRSRPSLCAV